MKSQSSLLIAALVALGGPVLNASTITGYHSPGTEPNPSGIGYSFLVKFRSVGQRERSASRRRVELGR